MTPRFSFLAFGLALTCACTGPAAVGTQETGYHLIPGSFIPNKGPDGNSIFLDAPEGLILVDTGRHPAHQEKLFAYARERGRPITAIVNTHWHLDHTGGNAEIREVYPAAQLHAGTALEGALIGFFPQSRQQAEAYLATGRAPAEQEQEIRRDFEAMDNPDAMRPTHPITASGRVTVSGRPLTFNLAPFAATEGDVWIYDEASKMVIAGDLVVAMMPFMDTACPDGWRRALDEIAATPFETLIPGHGDPMNRDQFNAWRTAFNNLLDCGASDRTKEQCVDGWFADAAQFISEDTAPRVRGTVGYYLDSKLKAEPDVRNRHCRPLAEAANS